MPLRCTAARPRLKDAWTDPEQGLPKPAAFAVQTHSVVPRYVLWVSRTVRGISAVIAELRYTAEEYFVAEAESGVILLVSTTGIRNL